MDKIYDKCCGIDVHKKLIVACFRYGRKQEVREFGATTRELLSLTDWLKEGGCEMVAMESTASYWKPLYNILESSDLNAMVVNAHHMKAVPGRKTDVKDAEWIADLLQHGLLQPHGTKKRTCKCMEKGIRDCKCNRIYHQPDCDIGWDSHRNRYYFGYDLYMLTAADSENDLPVFPFLSPASRHDSHGFLYNWFSMKRMLPDAVVKKLLLDSAHDAMPYYDYCKANGITPFIDLNRKCGRPPVYKDDITINKDGIPLCPKGFPMKQAAVEPKKGRIKYRCPKITCKGGTVQCTCEDPCSDAKYGRNVHLVLKDNPRLFNNPPRDSAEWKLEYNARTSAERCNKREKMDYKLEDGRYRSSMMWYCRLFAIMMCQHLDAWALPKSSLLKDLFEQTA